MSSQRERQRAGVNAPTRTSTTPAARMRPRPAGPARNVPPAGRPGRASAPRDSVAGIPLSPFRLVAAFALVLLMLLAAIPPGVTSPPDASLLVTPAIDGTGAIPGYQPDDATAKVFRYRDVVERSASSTVPETLSDVLYAPPNSRLARATMLGQMYASSTGNLNQTLVDTGFFSGLDNDKLEAIKEQYQSFAGDEKRGSRGVNGIAVVALTRSLDATGAERSLLENTALEGFQRAIDNEPKTWQFTYNWALCNMIMGNYTAAYEGMRGIGSPADADNNKLVPFWMGLAALRGGDPGEAIHDFTIAANAKAPEGGNEAFVKLYEQTRTLSQQGLGDAQWANRDPAGAYKTYYDNLLLGNTDDTGLYNKWLSLAFEQRAYEQLAADMANLEVSSVIGKTARLHHDRARLLTFLGRASEAEAEYRDALRISQNDAPLLISYGQFLLARGDGQGAFDRSVEAIRGLGKDPTSSDLSGVTSAVALTGTTTSELYVAQQLFDANMLRAGAWAKMGQRDNVTSLIEGIVAKAGTAPANQAGLLRLYAGYAAERSGLNELATANFQQAWDALKGPPAGTAGRGAALAGLARATAAAAGKSAADGLKVITSNGYVLKDGDTALLTNFDAPLLFAQAAQLAPDAQAKANYLRVASILGNQQDAHRLTGIGRPLWQANGAPLTTGAALAAANAARDAYTDKSDLGLNALRYREAFLLDPALAPAWNNMGAMYAQEGESNLASAYLDASGKASPGYALGRHNEAALQYKRGIGNFFTAEAAQADAIRSAGPTSLQWAYTLRPDERGQFPAPSAPAVDWLSRLPALLIGLLLFLQTVVSHDLQTNKMGLRVGKGPVGLVASRIDAAVKRSFPGLVRSGNSSRTLLLVVLVPAVIGMLGLAWGSGHGALEIALVFLPVALLAALIAFGANELASYLVARSAGGETIRHLWPTGLLLGVLSIPFGFVYGWQATTRIQPSSASPSEEESTGARRGLAGRRTRTGEDLDLAYEAQAEAIAEGDRVGGPGSGGTVVAPAVAGRFGLTPAARILFAGLAANLAIGLLFGLAYWLTAWPSLRLGMYASMLVLAFTAVSEPPADGWTVYRRNPWLWLGLFVFASSVVMLLAAGLM